MICTRKARDKARGLGRNRRDAGIGAENFLDRNMNSAGSDGMDDDPIPEVPVQIKEAKTKVPRKRAVEIVEEAPVTTNVIGWKGTVGSTSSQDRSVYMRYLLIIH